MKHSFVIALISTFAVFLVFFSVFLQLTLYLHPLVIAVLISCIFFLFYSFTLLLRKDTITLRYPLVLTILILYTIALLILLFFRPSNQSYHSWNLIPFSTISYYLSGKVRWIISFYNLAANIGLFIPYGLFLKLKARNFQLRLFLIPIVSIISIEILQFVTHRGSLDIDDLILNLLGVFLGYCFYPLICRIIRIQ